MTQRMRQAVTTLVMHHDSPRVLMVRRSSVGAFANQLVFPGGVIDEADANENWAETYTGGDGLDTDERVRRIAAARELFEETGVIMRDLSAMQPVSRWITPEELPVRFDTWFYILELPAGQTPIVDEVELTALEWVDPGAHVAACLRGEVSLMLPTLAHLDRLAEFGEAWGKWPTNVQTNLEPLMPTVVKRPDGKAVATIPAGVGFSMIETLM